MPQAQQAIQRNRGQKQVAMSRRCPSAIATPSKSNAVLVVYQDFLCTMHNLVIYVNINLTAAPVGLILVIVTYVGCMSDSQRIDRHIGIPTSIKYIISCDEHSYSIA
jgi:hypothetical protein